MYIVWVLTVDMSLIVYVYSGFSYPERMRRRRLGWQEAKGGVGGDARQREFNVSALMTGIRLCL